MLVVQFELVAVHRGCPRRRRSRILEVQVGHNGPTDTGGDAEDVQQHTGPAEAAATAELHKAKNARHAVDDDADDGKGLRGTETVAALRARRKELRRLDVVRVAVALLLESPHRQALRVAPHALFMCAEHVDGRAHQDEEEGNELQDGVDDKTDVADHFRRRKKKKMMFETVKEELKRKRRKALK